MYNEDDVWNLVRSSRAEGLFRFRHVRPERGTQKGVVRRDAYRAMRRRTSGACAASTKNAAPARIASRRAHRSASWWYRSGHIPSRYICHRRDQSALHSSGSTSTIVRIMSPRSSAPQPPLPKCATHGAPVSPRRAHERTEVGSTSLWWRR